MEHSDTRTTITITVKITRTTLLHLNALTLTARRTLLRLRSTLARSIRTLRAATYTATVATLSGAARTIGIQPLATVLVSTMHLASHGIQSLIHQATEVHPGSLRPAARTLARWWAALPVRTLLHRITTHGPWAIAISTLAALLITGTVWIGLLSRTSQPTKPSSDTFTVSIETTPDGDIHVHGIPADLDPPTQQHIAHAAATAALKAIHKQTRNRTGTAFDPDRVNHAANTAAHHALQQRPA